MTPPFLFYENGNVWQWYCSQSHEEVQELRDLGLKVGYNYRHWYNQIKGNCPKTTTNLEGLMEKLK